MKRLLFLCLTVSLLALSASAADDNIRAAQERLKQDGFYFGNVNGKAGSETSAAITRFQIRNGLPITGQLDAETAKALGVSVAPATVLASEESDTWQRLRKSDRKFLTRMNAAQPSADAPQRLVLSPERLRDYVGAFVLAGLHPGVGRELEFFADRVSYYDQGLIGRDKLRRDLAAYNARWPQRRFWLAGDVRVKPQPDSRIRVTFPLRYQLANGNKRSSGKIEKSLLLEVVGEDLQIVAVNERKL